MPDINDPFAQGFFFAKGDPANLKMREKIALAQMMQKRKVPTNLGEGIYSIGQDIGDALSARSLMDADKDAQLAASKLGAPKDPGAITPVADVSGGSGGVSQETGAAPPIAPAQAAGPSIVPAAPAVPAPPDVPGAIRMSTPAQLTDFRAQNPLPRGLPPVPQAGPMPPPRAPPPAAFAPPVVAEDPASLSPEAQQQRRDVALTMLKQQMGGQGGPPRSVPAPGSAPAPPLAPGQGIKPAPPMQMAPGQPAPIAGYVPPEMANPTGAKIIQPSRRELELTAVLNANQGNPYAAQSPAADELKRLVETRQRQQTEQEELFKADITRATKREEQRQAGLMDQASRVVGVEKEREAVTKAQLETDILRRTGGLGNEALLAPVVKSQERVAGVPGATQSLRNARLQLEQGIFTGAGAEQKLAMAKSKETLASLFGVDASDPKIANTEAFRATIMPLVAQARSATSGNANISDADIKLALSAVGGDITLDAKTFPRVLDALERINLGLAIGHQGRVTAAAGGNETAAQALQGAYGLPMEDIIPPRFIQRLKEHPETAGDFDKTFKTPGLSRRILGQ